MARIRTIKPEAFISESLASVSLSAERTFFGLLTQADDRGRHRDHAAIIAGLIWPLRPEHTAMDVEDDLQQLADAGLICRYTADGSKAYLHFVTWRLHQKIDRPSASRNPACPVHDGERIAEPSPKARGALAEASPSPRGVLTEGLREKRENASNQESAGQKAYDEHSTNTRRGLYESAPSPQGPDLGPRILDLGSVPSGGASAPRPRSPRPSSSSANTSPRAPTGRPRSSSATSAARSTNSSPNASTPPTSAPPWTACAPKGSAPACCPAWSTRS